MKLVRYCLDTHALVWYFRKRQTLSLKAELIFDEIFTGKSIGVISPITLLEAYHISLKDKNFVFTRFQDFMKRDNIFIVPFDQTLLPFCYDLSKKADIHDRIIAATAIATKSILVTKDEILRSLSDPETVW
ncbi:MAG: PIN domain-containing protein [Patescibacteria group bacterium]